MCCSCFVVLLSVRTKCIHHETFTFCSCLGGACCVNRGLRSKASWPPLSILTNTFSTWFHLMVTCSPWSMKALSGWAQHLHPRYWETTLWLYGSINHVLFYSEVQIWIKGSNGVFAPLCVLQECYLENDQTSLYHTAKGLMTLQALYGTIPQIYGKGDCARVSVLLNHFVLQLLIQGVDLFEKAIICLCSACGQHDAKNEEGVCWESESDLACIRYSAPVGP